MIVSVIIPTYNRRASVERTLESLRHQSLAPDSYEVLVVDDGSTDDTALLASCSFPFDFHYLPQNNQGATEARNHGARRSCGEILVFVDDDMTLAYETLEALASLCQAQPQLLAQGCIVPRCEVDSPFSRIALAAVSPPRQEEDSGLEEVHFTFCNTELLALRRCDFFDLGMFQDPSGGWPNWDDVDFGYRAHLAGFRLLRSQSARGDHWDHSLADLERSTRRWWKASHAAAALFRTHPALQAELPMFRDKLPIRWNQDPLIAYPSQADAANQRHPCYNGRDDTDRHPARAAPSLRATVGTAISVDPWRLDGPRASSRAGRRTPVEYPSRPSSKRALWLTPLQYALPCPVRGA